MTPLLVVALTAVLYGNVVTPLPVVTPDSDWVVTQIDSSFDDVSNRALLYAGSPGASPRVLAQMRRLYMEAQKAVHELDRKKRGADYRVARKAVADFQAFVNQHPPGIVVPPVVNTSD